MFLLIELKKTPIFEKIIKYVLYGQGERITGPFVKQTDFYNPNIIPLPYDPDGALKLLAKRVGNVTRKVGLKRMGKSFNLL